MHSKWEIKRNNVLKLGNLHPLCLIGSDSEASNKFSYLQITDCLNVSDATKRESINMTLIHGHLLCFFNCAKLIFVICMMVTDLIMRPVAADVTYIHSTGELVKSSNSHSADSTTRMSADMLYSLTH